MNQDTKVWFVRGGEPEELSLRYVRNENCDFFTTEAEAWAHIAEKERAEARHKQLGADEANARAVKAEAKARALAEPATSRPAAREHATPTRPLSLETPHDGGGSDAE